MAVHRVVIEVSVDGAEQWEAIVNNVENIQKAFHSDGAEIEVVAHGKGIGLVQAGSPERERIEATSGVGVTFAACENTTRRLNLTTADLLLGTVTVDSGAAEVIRQQEGGWAYLKGGG